MFYDDVFRRITETGAFSQKGVVTVGSVEYELSGIFCSGSYGQKEYDKGYSTAKTVKRQTFKVSLSSLPAGITPKDLIRQKLTVNGEDWVIDDITGNQSGILNFSLKGAASA